MNSELLADYWHGIKLKGKLILLILREFNGVLDFYFFIEYIGIQFTPNLKHGKTALSTWPLLLNFYQLRKCSREGFFYRHLTLYLRILP
jgi:hypothetical protein